MPTSTTRLHQVLHGKPEKIYRAFLDAKARARCLPPNGFTCPVDHLDAKIGGNVRMTFRNYSMGNDYAFSSRYQELMLNERIGYTDTSDDAHAAPARW